MTSDTISIPRKEYESLRKKATLFEHFVESEKLTKEELESIQKALNGQTFSKSEFLKKHADL